MIPPPQYMASSFWSLSFDSDAECTWRASARSVTVRASGESCAVPLDSAMRSATRYLPRSGACAHRMLAPRTYLPPDDRYRTADDRNVGIHGVTRDP